MKKNKRQPPRRSNDKRISFAFSLQARFRQDSKPLVPLPPLDHHLEAQAKRLCEELEKEVAGNDALKACI